MSKKKKTAKTAKTNADGERIVHAEEMHASLGEVLETEHVEEAIELLYKKEELPPGEPVATDEIAAREALGSDADVAGSSLDAARAEDDRVVIDIASARPGVATTPPTPFVPKAANDAPAEAAKSASSSTETAKQAAKQKLSLLQRLSPLRLARAVYGAAHELKEGVNRAQADLKDAAQKARQQLAL